MKEVNIDNECKQCGIEGSAHIFDCPMGHTKHDFKFSHQERIPQYSTGTNEILIDVVVCSDCGKIIRNKSNPPMKQVKKTNVQNVVQMYLLCGYFFNKH